MKIVIEYDVMFFTPKDQGVSVKRVHTGLRRNEQFERIQKQTVVRPSPLSKR